MRSFLWGALYYLVLAGYGVALYLVNIGRISTSFYGFEDYARIYRGAQDLANGMELSNTGYFAIYTNNLKPMLLLSLLFRAEKLFHMPEGSFALAVAVLHVLLAAWSVGVLVDREGSHRWRFPVLIAFMACLPIWAMTGAFYTDTMSFGMGVSALAFLKLAFKEEKRKSLRISLSILAAFCTVLGIVYKVTSVIVLMAAAIVFLLYFDKKKGKMLLIYLACTVVFYGGLNLWTNSTDAAKAGKVSGNPLISWVALGLSEDGSWNNNRAFVEVLNVLPTTEEKTAYSLAYIREHRGNFADGDHLAKKLSRNFANGNLGAAEFLADIEESDGTLLWELFSPWGRYYWRMSQYCLAFLAMLYVLLLFGGIRELQTSFQGSEIGRIQLICLIAFLGIFIFLMLWEANPRQLYNQMPMMILGAFAGISRSADLRERENGVLSCIRARHSDKEKR